VLLRSWTRYPVALILFPGQDLEAYGELRIFLTLLGGTVLGVTTLGFIAGEAYMARMAALQVISAVSDEDRDLIDEMSDDGVAEVLPHALSSRTKRPHSGEDSGRMVTSREC